MIVHNIIRDIQERPNSREISPSYFWNLIEQDRDDDKYVDCAVAAGADYVISNDRHFKVLNAVNFPKIEHITLNEVQPQTFDGTLPVRKD
jgi:predicted nucleic acid-binding protein